MGRCGERWGEMGRDGQPAVSRRRVSGRGGAVLCGGLRALRGDEGVRVRRDAAEYGRIQLEHASALEGWLGCESASSASTDLSQASRVPLEWRR